MLAHLLGWYISNRRVLVGQVGVSEPLWRLCDGADPSYLLVVEGQDDEFKLHPGGDHILLVETALGEHKPSYGTGSVQRQQPHLLRSWPRWHRVLLVWLLKEELLPELRRREKWHVGRLSDVWTSTLLLTSGASLPVWRRRRQCHIFVVSRRLVLHRSVRSPDVKTKNPISKARGSVVRTRLIYFLDFLHDI